MQVSINGAGDWVLQSCIISHKLLNPLSNTVRSCLKNWIVLSYNSSPYSHDRPEGDAFEDFVLAVAADPNKDNIFGYVSEILNELESKEFSTDKSHNLFFALFLAVNSIERYKQRLNL